MYLYLSAVFSLRYAVNLNFQQISILCYLTIFTQGSENRNSSMRKMTLEVVFKAYVALSTVVTLKTTPLSHSIMKRRCENGQHPIHSRSDPA